MKDVSKTEMCWIVNKDLMKQVYLIGYIISWNWCEGEQCSTIIFYQTKLTPQSGLGDDRSPVLYGHVKHQVQIASTYREHPKTYSLM